MEAASDKRWRLVRTLRNATALALLAISIGILALWGRSMTQSDRIRLNGGEVHVYSALGVLNFWYSPQGKSDNVKVSFSSLSIEEALPQIILVPERLKIGNRIMGSLVGVFAPHWFVALVVAALALSFKPKPRLRFRISDILLLMTFAAVLIAGVAALGRLAALP
jgi:hypothetical protein